MSQNDNALSPTKWPLDPTLLNLNEQETLFFKSLTGIQDDEELKAHIIEVQTKAYEVHSYPCIQRFAFTTLKISRLPAYQHVLQLSQILPGAILLDVGCCFGNDLRKAVADGWPVENAIASDLQAAFWDYGHELFKSTPDTFTAAFVPGDAFSPTIIEPREPVYSKPPNPCPSNLHTLKSLTPLQGHISAIHASSLFHLFDEEKQLLLAKRLATLLSPEPGSIIFGSHGGRPTRGLRTEAPSPQGRDIFCHSPESWQDLWDGQVFKKDSVRVEVKTLVLDRKPTDLPVMFHYWLVWSVTRL